jgi:hypothetical protein
MHLQPGLIPARTGDGRVRAKARGVCFYRPPKLNLHQRQEAMRRLVSSSTWLGGVLGQCQSVREA